MDKKKKIMPNLRKGLIGLLALLFTACVGMAIWWFNQPVEMEQQVPLYTFEQGAAIDYQVYFTENVFLPDISAGPGKAYITSLTDYVDTVFTYQVAGEQKADIKGQYQVTAALDGYVSRPKPGSQNNEKELVPLFSKEDILIEATPFQANDTNLTLSAEFQLDYGQYADFINNMIKELRLSAELVQLTVTFEVNSQITTPEGVITQQLSPVMVIPIEGTAFMVQGQLVDQKTDSITQAQITEVPGVKNDQVGWGVAAAVFLLLLLGMIFGTQPAVIDPVTQELKTIMKKHGDWIAAGKGKIPALSPKKILILEAFEDLVKIADEVGQPILYENIYVGIHTFYVLSEPLIYRYELKPSPAKPAEEETIVQQEENEHP